MREKERERERERVCSERSNYGKRERTNDRN